MNIKLCSSCGFPKDIEEFPIRYKDPLVRRGQCKSCFSDKFKLYQKEWEKLPHAKAYRAKLRAVNADKYAEYQREYLARPEKAEKRKKWNREYQQKRLLDPFYRLSTNISRSIRSSIRSNKGGRKWEDILGYSLQDLKNHLEKQFISGMTWANYGKWHIDHKRPIASFNITSTDCEDFKVCWALSNLQPLWAKDNIQKRHFWKG
jgi:hypothetical protein